MKDTMEYCINLIFNIANWNYAKFVCSSIFASLVLLLGDSGYPFLLLLLLVVIDLLMALLVVARTDMRFESSKLRHTAIKLSVYFLIVVAGVQFDSILNFPNAMLIPDEPIAKIALVILAATEMLSVLEHASQLGFVIPIRLLSNIKKYRDGQ